MLGMVGWIGWVGGIFVLTVISALTKGRLPLWAMILGGGTLAAVTNPSCSQAHGSFYPVPDSSAGDPRCVKWRILVTIVVELLEDVTPGGSASAKAADESADGDAIAGAPDTGLAPAAESSTVSGSE